MRDYEKIIEEAKASHLPYESWERLPGETGAAFAAFCAYRDYGLERNIRKAVDSVEKDEVARAKHYQMWRNWCAKYRWYERAADYDNYTEKLKQTEIRKTIEEQGKVHREITGKMLRVVGKGMLNFIFYCINFHFGVYIRMCKDLFGTLIPHIPILNIRLFL